MIFRFMVYENFNVCIYFKPNIGNTNKQCSYSLHIIKNHHCLKTWFRVLNSLNKKSKNMPFILFNCIQIFSGIVIIHRQGVGIYAGSSRNNCFGYKSQFKTLLVSTRLLTLSKHYLIYKTQTFIFHNILQGIMFQHRRCSEIQIPYPGDRLSLLWRFSI